MNESVNHIMKLIKTDINLPTNYDPREKYSQCWSFHHVPDQGSCGSCWVKIREIRDKIYKEHETDVILSHKLKSKKPTAADDRVENRVRDTSLCNLLTLKTLKVFQTPF